jgi:DNA N-6-adenine-methyltransferase (Dam)
MRKRAVGRSRKYPTNAARQRAYRRRLKRWVHFRSETGPWETPPPLFNQLHAEFGFTLDVWAPVENAKCASYFTPADDGLAQV